MNILSISAAIILYEPDKERLMQNIKIIYNDVKHIYVYNNGASYTLIKSLMEYSKVIVLGDGKNIGIAAAMNKVMEEAEIREEEWIVTFDQDSVSDSNLILEYKKTDITPDVAILCPQVIDERRKYILANKSYTIESVARCITSASCTNVEAWKKVGGFDDYLFIDLVDNDFCKRLKLQNWKILRLNNVVLNQEFGDIQLKSKFTVDIIMKISDFVKKKLHLYYLADNIGKLTYKKNVSPMRVYYTNRNVIYLNKKFSNYGGIGYDCYKCKSYLGFNICFNLASFLRGKNKIKILKAIFCGMRDGLKCKITPVP